MPRHADFKVNGKCNCRPEPKELWIFLPLQRCMMHDVLGEEKQKGNCGMCLTANGSQPLLQPLPPAPADGSEGAATLAHICMYV